MKMSEKILEAKLFATLIKRYAESLGREGNSYDCTWHREYVQDIRIACDNFLKKIK